MKASVGVSVGIAVSLVVCAVWWRVRRRDQSVSDPLFPCEVGEVSLGPQIDWAFLDAYLSSWDRFAQGENALVPSLRQNVNRFNAELARALQRDPSNAAGRAIMYPLLQVGGFVPLDSAVGKALSGLFDRTPPPVINRNGRQYYFAGDLYFWWKEHRGEFAPCSLFDDWCQRQFAIETAIPMYEAVRANGT